MHYTRGAQEPAHLSAVNECGRTSPHVSPCVETQASAFSVSSVLLLSCIMNNFSVSDQQSLHLGLCSDFLEDCLC